ncbi:hypothetical protein ACFVX9_29315 [Kitasatospora sp. NPDC058243]|uniref:hypothetical protein n=1 Tax=Kitasatospora sp. NPDC058243 TaxID=3346397 RepID=UPI0036DD0703
MIPPDAPGAGVDASRLADGSHLADALTNLGPNGIRALGHLRDAQQKLAETDRWSQPLESALASCRSAIDSLLKEAGEAFEGPRDAQERVNQEVAALLKRSLGQQTAMERLAEALDSTADIPDILEPKAGVGAGIQRLIRIPPDRLPCPVDPRPQYEAELELLDTVATLEALPSTPEDQRALVAVLRRLQQARRHSGAAELAARADGLAGLREAFDYRMREQQDGGAFRRRQLAHIVQQRTGSVPGLGEQEAFRAWAKFYQQTSSVLHGSAGEGEASTRKLFADLVAHVEQLVLGLPRLAPLLVPLVRAQRPTPEDGEVVAALQQPRAVRYFFVHAVSPGWLDLVSDQRLLPERGHWPAQPYLERVAATNPHRALAWLSEKEAAFRGVDPEVLAGLLQVARRIGGPGTSLVRAVLGSDGFPIDALWQLVVLWLFDVPAIERDPAWVEVAKRVLLHVVEHCAGQRWEIQQQLTELQKAAYSASGLRDTAVIRAVRAALTAVAAGAMESELELADLDVADDLRQVVSANDFTPSVARIAVRALLDFARTEAAGGVTLAQRTAGWAGLPGPRRWTDRLLAAHLLETIPRQQDDEDDEQTWLSAAHDVLSRLGAVARVGADIVDLVAAALEHCRPDALPDLEALLTTALGPAPAGSALDDGLQALAGWPVRVPDGWATVWGLSPVLPPAVLAPWQPVVDAIAELVGAAPRKPLTRLRPVPYLDHFATTVRELSQLASEKGALAAAATLLDRRRTGALSPDYARIILGQLVTADPASWTGSVPTVVAALEEPALQHSYLSALRTPLTAEPCPLPDPAATWRAAIDALWELVADPGRDPSGATQTQLTLCLHLDEAWACGVDLGTVEPLVTEWLTAVVTTWIVPTGPSADDPLRAAYGEISGLALDALINWGLNRTAGPDELPAPAEDVLSDLLDAGTNHRALAVIGHRLPALLEHAPDWAEQHRAQLFDLERPHCPALTGITSRGVADQAAIDLLRRLDRGQLAKHLRQHDRVNQTMWEVCAALLLIDPATLGGRQAFLALLATDNDGAAAVSHLLSVVGRLLPPEATEANEGIFTSAVDLWRDVLGLDLPDDAGHLRGAGKFVYAQALDDTVWLEMTALTVEQTAAVSAADAVARRAAQHPDAETAHRIVAALLTLYEDISGTGLPSYRLDEIKRTGIALWTAARPDTPGRRQLGEALAQYADFLEAVV